MFYINNFLYPQLRNEARLDVRLHVQRANSSDKHVLIKPTSELKYRLLRLHNLLLI
jgi:hypothetical protein